ncbi:hypothetical protein PVK06_024881 [Gossypium arboreum]|uniref:Aminotransferase-like plant mobile domain-containing protein n=1 Tax=Gossypium arboreum TaxID=29729 RepID=A0ABR0PFD0_GOSAR|nr:hypothetical protein PVK06_024881 [Gossypium arboreum]
MALMGRGCKLDPTLISTLVKRWRLEMHTCHPPYDECTITLKGVQLQLGLPVDGMVVTGPVVVADWRDINYQKLSKPYLPVEEAKGRKPHIRRPRRMPRHPRSSAAFKAGLSSTLTQELTSMATPPPVSFVFGPFSSTYYMLVQLAFQMTMMLMTTYRPSMFGALTESLMIMPLMYRTQYGYTPTPIVSQTPLRSLFYRGGPS